MFLGHYAVGFAARGARPAQRGPSLGTWFLAVQWLDLVWPVFVVTGIERVVIRPTDDPFLRLDFTYYPWSHSLLAALVWAAVFGLVYRSRTRNGQGALWLSAGVVSHWVLDVVVHVPDLPLYPGSAVKLGLGLWNSPAATLIVETVLYVGALLWYCSRTKAVDKTGRRALWALGAFLVAAYLSSVAGPPPPGETAVGASALLLWLLPPWGYWIDQHRK